MSEFVTSKSIERKILKHVLLAEENDYKVMPKSQDGNKRKKINMWETLN